MSFTIENRTDTHRTCIQETVYRVFTQKTNKPAHKRHPQTVPSGWLLTPEGDLSSADLLLIPGEPLNTCYRRHVSGYLSAGAVAICSVPLCQPLDYSKRPCSSRKSSSGVDKPMESYVCVWGGPLTHTLSGADKNKPMLEWCGALLEGVLRGVLRPSMFKPCFHPPDLPKQTHSGPRQRRLSLWDEDAVSLFVSLPLCQSLSGFNPPSQLSFHKIQSHMACCWQGL